MKYLSFELLGSCMRDYNTEIRFDVASAKYDNAELISFTIPRIDDEKESSRLYSCAIKVIGTLMREGLIQFYVSPEHMRSGATQAEFIKNKYSDFISSCESDRVIYVKT